MHLSEEILGADGYWEEESLSFGDMAADSCTPPPKDDPTHLQGDN